MIDELITWLVILVVIVMDLKNFVWDSESVCLNPPSLDIPNIASSLYSRTCRTDFDAPGFCLLNLGRSLDSQTFRQIMVDLKQEMASIHEAASGKTLTYLSVARFDQQTTTKPHLDSGPEECFLMLGYEPSDVDSVLEISDYTRCAFDLGISTLEFMSQYNPMFQPGYDLLRPYTTRIPCFSKKDYQIVCVNNSSASKTSHKSAWLGTLHTATIISPDESKRRVINSTMIASVPMGTSEIISESEVTKFINSTIIRRRGYDALHLDDDL